MSERGSRYGRSVAYLKFIRRHEHELQVHWHTLVSIEYAARWLASLPDTPRPTRLSTYPGDARAPFTFIDVSSDAFLGFGQAARQSVAQRTVVQLVTAHETYIYDALQRAVYVNPNLIADSQLSVAATTIARAVQAEDVRAWFAHYVAGQYCRNRTHAELMTRLAALVRSGVARQHKTAFESWQKWVLVRNAIVHQGGDVTSELSEAWPKRFPSRQAAITLCDDDIVQIADTSRVLLKSLDRRLVDEVLCTRDQELLARELFVRSGDQDPVRMAQRVNKLLGSTMSKNDAERAIAVQRRCRDRKDGFVVTEDMLGSAWEQPNIAMEPSAQKQL